MNQINSKLEQIQNKNDQFERFMTKKSSNDEITSKKIDELITCNNNNKINVTQHEIKITRHENIFTKLIFPFLDEISTFLTNLNSGKHNDPLDADFKVKINRENAHGGVVILVRNDIKTNRLHCDLPNVCIVDILNNSPLRILGIYAPDSKSWHWDNLSPFLSSNCILFGDYNIDLDKDKSKAETLLNWADLHFLTPYIPSQSTSIRSDRIIDFALTSGFHINMQTYEGGTSSDHKPILSSVPHNINGTSMTRNIHWNVFTWFCEFAFSFWDKTWLLNDSSNNVYNDYITFISLLTSRCTILFPLNKYRVAIPQELRNYLSLTRALSFKQKRTGDMNLKQLVNDRRKIGKKELKRFLSEQLSCNIEARNTTSPRSLAFWSKAKLSMKTTSSSLHGFALADDVITKDPIRMCEAAADYYEEFFKESASIYHPHPYTDAPDIEWENFDEKIPHTNLMEVLEVVKSRRKKKSCDAHGLSNYMFTALPDIYWSFLINIFNKSFSDGVFPIEWKDTRILLLPKKDPICQPSNTRPISLLDVFLKINEKLFHMRFVDILKRRGILPDTQSGFREDFRLQTRVLLFLEQVSSLMANSSPVATIFVDFKAAFDQLWFEGCLGKLKRMGIPRDYLRWINTWLTGRRAFIEIDGEISRWFNISKGCPQGSIFSPTLFITYNSDMGDFLGGCMSHFFADDLAAILAANEPSLDDQCRKYWDKYLIALSESIDGELLLEQCNLNTFRANWVKKQFTITGIFHSKRYIEHAPLLERIIKWCLSIPPDESIPNYDIDEIMIVAEFSNTF
ncbi:unnamed protein product [Rotaria magnacalcarata]|uniref:Reverse transcriptase domain-containing protein n=1 Tax=Rotaria magnacalcarata TaxID=392030 RepID=A0A815Z076_9BILA|nr:unnamed protein product [Rotaria magnacalcarata]